MDRVWDTSKYPSKPFVTLYQGHTKKVIQGHEVKKVKFKILGLGGVIHVFRSDMYSSRTQKNGHRTLLEQPISDKM